MKLLCKGLIILCAAIAFVAAGAWESGWCSAMMLFMITMACACVIFVAAHELSVIREYEEATKEAIKRSAWKAEFFREVDKL